MMDEEEEITKIEKGLERHARQEVRKLLYPFLNKKDDVRPATLIMRLITELYEDLFKKKLTFTYDEAKERTSAGHGAQFTKLIIDEMELGRYFEPELTIETHRANPDRRGQKDAKIADTRKNDKRRKQQRENSKKGRKVRRVQFES